MIWVMALMPLALLVLGFPVFLILLATSLVLLLAFIDVPLAQLCKEVLGEKEWRFVSPRKRAGKDHLTGFDPDKAPKVVDPDHIKEAANDYYDKYWKDYWKRLADKHAKATA